MTAAAFLDTLLPGGEGFPAASALGLAEWVAGHDRFAPALDAALALFPPDFAGRDAEARTALVAEAETAHPETLGAAVVAAYSGYYTHPAVLAVIEARCGYKARPPQPGGYALPGFDEAMLAVPRARAPLYRDPAKEAGT